jgi:hypothetical protein
MKKTQGYFITHCDNPECDLGSFYYKCPVCKKNNIDYDIWWKQDNILCGESYDIECEECHETLKVIFSDTIYQVIEK